MTDETNLTESKNKDELIEINITEGEKKELVSSYIKDNLSKTSSDYFTDMLEAGLDFNTVVVDVIFNDIVINCLQEYVDENEKSE